MENKFFGSSNTLENLVNIAEGQVLDIKLMLMKDASGKRQVSVLITGTPMAKDLSVKPLPPLKGLIDLDKLDAEITNDMYEVYQGSLSQSVHRLAAIQKGVAKAEKEEIDKDKDKAKEKAATAAAKTGKPGAAGPVTPADNGLFAAIPTPAAAAPVASIAAVVASVAAVAVDESSAEELPDGFDSDLGF